MKIGFATKNYHHLLEELCEYIEENEIDKESSVPSFIPGVRKGLISFDNQTEIESRVEGQEIYLLSGMINEEFLEMIDMVDFFIKENVEKINVIFPSPTWSESLNDKETNPLSSRIEILNSLYSEKNETVKFYFLNPSFADDIETLISANINYKILFSEDIINEVFSEISKVKGDTSFVNITLDDNRGCELVYDYCFYRNIKYITKYNDISYTTKKVILFSSTINQKQKWNVIAKRIKEEFKIEEVYAFIPHCPCLAEGTIDKELFENVIITNSWFNSYLNCMGEDGFQMKSIVPTIYKKILNK